MGGRKTGGGSRKGCPNKATAIREAEIKASGLTPVGYMFSVLRDPEIDQKRRDWAAQAAAPYCHHRLSQTDVKQEIDLRALMLQMARAAEERGER